MKSPWVARERLDQAEDRLRAAHAEALNERDLADLRSDNLQRRYDDLLSKFMALRVQGATLEPEPPVYAPAPTAAYDALRDLIDQRSNGNLRVRAMMLRQLAIDRAEGSSDEAIRVAIEQGVPSDGVPG